jgi:hypothetical protein
MPRKRKLSPKKAVDFKSKKARTVSASSGSSGINLQSLTEKLKNCNPDCGIVVNFSAKEVPSEQPKSLPSNPLPDFMFADFVDLKSDKCATVFSNSLANRQLLMRTFCSSSKKHDNKPSVRPGQNYAKGS